MYASIHLMIFLVLDYNLIGILIYREIIQKPFILLGLGAFTILLLMASTSFNWTIAKLGKYWKRLHRLVYLVAVIVVIHYFLALKGNILNVSGNIIQPLIYGLIVITLLLMRIPAIKNLIQHNRPPRIRIILDKHLTDTDTTNNLSKT